MECPYKINAVPSKPIREKETDHRFTFTAFN